MYNISEVLEDFNKLYNLYLNCTDIEQKNIIYSQMQFLYAFDKKLSKERFSKIGKMEKYSNNVTSIELNRFKEIEDLTYILCSYIDVLSFNGYNSSKFIYNKITENEYYDRILNFFKEVLPSDYDLADKSINKYLLLTKSYLYQQAYIVYLESIKKYYINIIYNGKLRNSDVRNTIHEIGHASVYKVNGTYNLNDPILTEVIAYLYELLYLYNYIEKNNCDKEKELGYYFYTSLGDRTIYNHIEGYNTSLSDKTYLCNLKAFYGNLIAATIFLNSSKDELIKKIDIVKNNYDDKDGFNVLNRIGIHTDDLIYTSKNMKELVKKRLY